MEEWKVLIVFCSQLMLGVVAASHFKRNNYGHLEAFLVGVLTFSVGFWVIGMSELMNGLNFIVFGFLTTILLIALIVNCIVTKILIELTSICRELQQLRWQLKLFRMECRQVEQDGWHLVTSSWVNKEMQQQDRRCLLTIEECRELQERNPSWKEFLN